MQKFIHLKQIILLLGLMLPAVWCGAKNVQYGLEGPSNVPIKVSHVQSVPKSSSIQASINGHYLTVVFTENLGQVAIEVTTPTGAPVDGTSTITPTGIQIYIPNSGDYIVTFTLPNGDEYYGEFTVTD